MDKKHSKGTETYLDGSQYRGGFKNGYYSGYGVMTWKRENGDRIYSGEWAMSK